MVSQPRNQWAAGRRADGDGIAMVALDFDVGDAPERPRHRLGVLIVQRIGVLGLEGLAGAPPSAQALAFDGAVDVGGEEDAIVFVRLPEEAFGVRSLEVHGDVEVPGDQVGQAVGRHLVGDVEALVEVLDRDVLAGLGVRQHLHHRLLGRQQGAREVVGLHPLAHVVLEVDRVVVAEGEVPQGLGDHRAGRAHPADEVALGHVDDPVPRSLIDRVDGGQVLDPGDREPEIGGHVRQVALGHRTRSAIADGVRACPAARSISSK